VKTPAYWGIMGFPIAHSLTPKLFKIVGNHLGIREVETVFLEVKSIEEFEDHISNLEGDIWLSCTTPIKHSISTYLEINTSEGVNAINQLIRNRGSWRGKNTDGLGFLAACRHIGINPTNSILKIRGGGSTARSITEAWAADGGKIVLQTGRREITSGPWNKAIIDSLEATIAIDLDTEAGGGKSAVMEAEHQVSISYDKDTNHNEFAVIMVAAQHLEAWKTLYTPERKEDLPSLSLLLEELSFIK
tara:strand:+ start:61 stop:798 length:738 start_codon:yes stop_codon:yes gene_type:complete